MKRTALFFPLLLIFPMHLRAQDFVPLPVEVTLQEGYFYLPPILRIYHSPEVKPLADYLETELRRLYRFDAVRKTEHRKLPSDSKGIIQLYVDAESALPAEGYWLNVSGKDILIAGKDYGGVFNGIQTLMQMLPDATPFCSDCKAADIPVRRISVTDYPHFGYRGMMLDAARTFVPKVEVKKYIDRLSRHKINKFHWHLTDDEGWRIEIKSRPELAAVGGYRGGDSPLMPVYGEWKRKYGGYYTQDDIREIVEYAAVRNVEIIPEIDLPGHSRAAARAMPEILCRGSYDASPSNGYDLRNVWCASREENYDLLCDVLGEIAQLFPSPYIHIGGDEVLYGQWMACPDCRELMAHEGFADGTALHSHFTKRICAILARYGKRAAIWNGAGTDGMPSEVRIYGWESPAACVKAAANGYGTVVMPSSYFYFDMKYSDSEPGLRWAGIIPTEKVYSFDFAGHGFSPETMGNVAGIEGAMWHELGLQNGSEYIYRQSYPRVCALAEIAWSPEGSLRWDDFNERMERTHYGRLARMGIRYRTEPTAVSSAAQTYITPPFTVKSSLPQSKSNPYSHLTSYNWKSTANTSRGAREGDYILFTFAQPVDCGSIEIVTGYEDLPRCLFPSGYADVEYAGFTGYTRFGELKNGRITISPAAPVKAVRIVCTSPSIGDKEVIIQPLKITARRESSS